MNIRRNLAKISANTSQIEDNPEWALNGSATTKLLYKIALEELNAIETKYVQSKGKVQFNAKLVLSTIAKKAGNDKSLLSKRRQPDLHKWIGKKNSELARLVFKQPKKITPPQGTLKLKRQIAQLNSELKQLQNEKLKTFVEAVFESNLLDDRDKLASDVSQLRLDKDELINKNALLKRQNIKLLDELASYKLQ